VDDIWFYTGDRSIDMSWYSKRATLAAIYLSTELYMMEDKSPGFAETYAFLDRRFEDIRQFGKSKTQVTDAISGLFKICHGIFDPVSPCRDIKHMSEADS
jgi:ubiquinone biosynthesis protein COQ9